MARSPKPLYGLILSLFRSNDDVYEFLANYPYPKAAHLVAELPGPNVPRSTFAMAAVQQVQAHGLDRTELFDALLERFPARTASIEAGRRDYLGQGSDVPVEPRYGVDLGAAPSAALVVRFEKIMGDRPTFVDVAYLALGYQRSKSVAKLNMRFGADWYVGTAFFVAPDTLLTAHHNLWSGKGERADKVEVIVDFERAIDGKELRSQSLLTEPDSFLGDANNDWALLKVCEAQVDRPLSTLSAIPAREGDRVGIIQHPNGMVKQVALHHNLVSYAGDSRVQYLTDTMPGSSGSPVYDGHWNVVAIHHGGGDLPLPGTKQTVYRNEGIPIALVRSALASRGITL